MGETLYRDPRLVSYERVEAYLASMTEARADSVRRLLDHCDVCRTCQDSPGPGGMCAGGRALFETSERP